MVVFGPVCPFEKGALPFWAMAFCRGSTDGTDLFGLGEAAMEQQEEARVPW